MSDNTLVAAELAELRVENKQLHGRIATKDDEIKKLRHDNLVLRVGVAVIAFGFIIFMFMSIRPWR
jgi:cell division protein FtsB